MSGTISGGRLAAATNKRLYGKDFYERIGRAGGIKSRGGGFADRELARRAGKIGGTISRRGKKENLFVDDTTDFGEGFFAPSWKDKMISKIRSK